MSIPFTKIQSVGNHFVLVDLGLFSHDADLIAFAVKSGESRFGVGSDGLLGVSRDGVDLRVRMFNLDGTEDFCGNGLRCAAHWAYRKGWVKEKFTAYHLGREVPVEIDPSTMSIKTVIGRADFSPDSIPLEYGTGELFQGSLEIDGKEVIVSSVSTGTAHTVILTDELPDDRRFFKLGPRIEHYPIFPERTSVIWTKIESERRLRLRIWERGVGETLGCGSGTTAAAAVYMRLTRTTGEIEVMNPGGMLKVSGDSWHDDLTLEGKAQVVYTGEM